MMVMNIITNTNNGHGVFRTLVIVVDSDVNKTKFFRPRPK